MKINWVLVGLVVTMGIALGVLGKAAWTSHLLDEANSTLNKELMQANLELGRAKTQFGDAMKYADSLENALQTEIDERKAEITRYGKLLTEFNQLREAKGKVTYVYKDKVIIVPEELTLEPGLYRVKDKTLVMIESLEETFNFTELDATCHYDAMTEEMYFSYDLHLRFEGEFVETLLPGGAINHYFNMWSIDEDGNRLEKLTLLDFQMIVVDERKDQFFWWTPHFDIGLVLAVDTDPSFAMGGSFGISFMGYGRSKQELSWRFARVGLDFLGMPGVSIDPAMYNIGQHIPWMSNLWLSPHVVYTFDNKWSVGLMIGAQL